MLSRLLSIATLCLVTSVTGTASALTLANGTFEVQTGDSGEISSITLPGDAFPTNYVLNATNATSLAGSADHYWFGELMFTYRLAAGAWTRAYTYRSDDGRTITQNGNRITVTYENASHPEGIRNFRVVESYSLVDDYLYWEIAVTNTSAQNLEIGDLGLPLPFNQYWFAGDAIYETRVQFHSFIGLDSSYVTATRPSGIGDFLLMTPDASTGAGFEYLDHWRVEEHPGSVWAQDQGTPAWPNGLNVFYLHSNVIRSTNRGYLPNTSLTLAPSQTQTYAFKLFRVTSEDEVGDRLYTEGLVDATAVPGYLFATDMTAKLDLHTWKTIASLDPEYPAETSITDLGAVATDHHLFEIRLNHLGPNDITVHYGNGETTVLQFYALEPIGAALQRHATFMVENTQWQGGVHDQIFDDWMMDIAAKRNAWGGWGWGDDWGLTHGTFLAEKNVHLPVAAEVTAVDRYLETGIWNNLMRNHHGDYVVPDWLDESYLVRGYAFPHIYNTYFAMYEIAKRYPSLTSYIHPRDTYLMRAYGILQALYGPAVDYNWDTGLMGESTTPDIIRALREEGHAAEADWVQSTMSTKYANFSGTTYPYGSEYSFDNTGEEAVYTLAQMFGNTTMMSKINDKTRACRGQQPTWYFYANPVTVCGEAWWNFQYTASLAGIGMDDWVRYHSAQPELEQRLSYAAKLANISAINSGQIDADPANLGTVAWTYQAEKGDILGCSADCDQGGYQTTLHSNWRPMSGEADLGLFGAVRILSSDVAVDPIFGLFCYGCDVTRRNACYSVTPRDGIQQRLNLITEKVYLELDRDQYTSATVSPNGTYVALALENATPGVAHTTQFTATGLRAGSYDVAVGGTTVLVATVATGTPTVIQIPVGADAAYDVTIGSVASGCGSSGTGGAGGTGGAPSGGAGSGGTVSTGGSVAVGGSLATGGTVALGGSPTTGGATTSGGASPSGGALAAGTAGSAPEASGDDPGCGCRSTRGGHNRWLLGALGLALLGARRRRR